MPYPSLRFRSCLPLSVAAVIALAAPSARSQTVSDADRAAARELATQGIQLQQAGNYTEALDRFDRAQAVFSAPTHLLHIAECETALGKLVEAAETYRTLVRTPLPAGSPPAFVQAQQQGATELAQVEPRVPSIRVVVRPHVLPNTTVQIDGQAMSIALVGMQRPTDPGTHTVVLLAPGYARAEQKITLNEHETKDVAFNLGGVPGGYAPPPPAGATTPMSPTTPPPTEGATPTPPPPPQQTYGFQPQPPPPPPADTSARGGFMIGPTLGALIPAGNLMQGSSLNQFVGGGFALGVNAGFRFVRRLYLGAAFEHGFLSAGSSLTSQASGGTASADSNYIGAEFAVISHPNGSAFFAKVGAGYRFVDFSVQYPGGSTVGSAGATAIGPELSLGMGVHIKIGDWVRMIPMASVGGGAFNTLNYSGSNAAFTAQQSGSITNTDAHYFVLLGITTYVDFARKH